MNQLHSLGLFRDSNNKAYQENLKLKYLGCHSIMFGEILTHTIPIQDGKKHVLHARIGFGFAVKFINYSDSDLLDATEMASSTISRAIQFTSSREYSENMCLLTHNMSKSIAMLNDKNGHGELVQSTPPSWSVAST